MSHRPLAEQDSTNVASIELGGLAEKTRTDRAVSEAIEAEDEAVAKGVERVVQALEAKPDAEINAAAIDVELEHTEVELDRDPAKPLLTTTQRTLKAKDKQHFKSIFVKRDGESAQKRVNLTLYFKDPSIVTGAGGENQVDVGKAAVEGSENNFSHTTSMEDDGEVGVLSPGEPGGEGKKFGTWDGVYVSCLLNIFGVIMYLRLGWVVGQAGIIFACVIILLAGVVTTLTTMSMAAICTNGKVKGGGAYYLISRSLGPAMGGSIGVLFTIGICVAVAMYVIGFCETLVGKDMLAVCPQETHMETTCAAYLAANPTNETVTTEDVDGACQVCFEDLQVFTFTGDSLNDMRIWGVLTATVILIMVLIGVGWIIKLQFFFLFVIVSSIITFVAGSFTTTDSDAGIVGWVSSNIQDNLGSGYTSEGGVDYNFFKVFAIFFPAVTGIMAGANISGLLVDPSVNIPKGTFNAIAHSTVVYILLAFVLGAVVQRDTLLDPSISIMGKIEAARIPGIGWREGGIGILVLAGIFIATLSSAIASMVGAPQLLGAVAKDGVLPLDTFTTTYKRIGMNIFGKKILLSRPDGNSVQTENSFHDATTGELTEEGDPTLGYFLAYFLAVCCILIGDLNAVAPLISMFFMMTYGLINFSCFALEYTASPGWRPKFQFYSKWGCLLGTVLCIVAMFLTDVMWAIISFAIGAGLYLYIANNVRNGKVQTIAWGTAVDAQAKASAFASIVALRNSDLNHAKTFRPTYLVLTGKPEKDDRMHLCRFAYTLRKGHGGIILGSVIVGDYRQSVLRLRDEHSGGYFKINPSPRLIERKYGPFDFGSKYEERVDNRAYAPLEFVVAPSFSAGVGILLQTTGLGAVRPNIVLMGFKEDWKESAEQEVTDYVGAIRDTFTMRYGCMVARGLRSIDWNSPPERSGTVDVWWLIDDGGLTMLVPHLLSLAKFWRRHTEKEGATTVRLFFVLQGSSDSAEDLANFAKNSAEEFDRIKETVEQFRLSWEPTPVYMIPERSDEKQRRAPKLYTPDDSPSEDWMPLQSTVDEYEAMPGVQGIFEQKQPGWALRWLRIAELIKQYSSSGKTKLTFCTLPFPRSFHEPANYMGWLEILSNGKADGTIQNPFVMIRGNGHDCVTNKLE